MSLHVILVCVSNVSMYANVLSLVIIFNKTHLQVIWLVVTLRIHNTNTCHISIQIIQHDIVTQAET